MIYANLSEQQKTGVDRAKALFLSWIAGNRAQFSFRSEEHPIRQLSLLKPFAEFVLCNDLLLSYGARDSRLKANLYWAWEEIDQGDYLLTLLLARPDIFRVASVYAPLHRHGYRCAKLDEALQSISAMRSTLGAECQAWMRLCFLHSSAEIFGTEYDPSVVPETWLGLKPEPWCINDEIAYSLTHEVFYATDFGRSKCKFSNDILQYLRVWVPMWTRSYIEEKNWDLTAEMIMVAKCIGEVEWDQDVIAELLESQLSNGAVSGPAGSGGLLRQGARSTSEEEFLSDYHTTLVSAMAIWLAHND